MDSICHHAWFEGDGVALPREDRVYLLGNVRVRTLKKRRTAQSSSCREFPNVASSISVETEQHELEPEETGANELGPDEMAGDDEDGASTVAPTVFPTTVPIATGTVLKTLQLRNRVCYSQRKLHRKQKRFHRSDTLTKLWVCQLWINAKHRPSRQNRRRQMFLRFSVLNHW